MSLRRRVCSFRIDAHEMVGKRLRVDGHFSRTGIQVYGDGTGRDIREYRSPEEVFSPVSLDSLRGMPVTVRHPKGVGGLVTPSNWAPLAGKGVVVGQTGDTVGKADDSQHTRGFIWLHDAKAIGRVQTGELTELSVGYTATVDTTPGVTPEGEHFDAQQRNILGNHIALLGGGEARGGPTVRILDAAGHVRLDDEDPPKEEAEMETSPYNITLDGLSHEVQLPKGSNFPEAWAKVEKLLSDADASEAKADALAKELEGLKAELAEARDPKVQADAAKAYAQLMADAERVAGKPVDGDTDSLTIRRSALEAKGIDLAGKSDSYVEARFDHEASAAPKGKKADAADKLRGKSKSKSKAVELTAEQKSFTKMGGR